MGFISLIITALGLGQGLVDRTLLEQRKKYDQRTLFLDLGAGAAYTTEYTLNTEYWFISNLIPKKKKMNGYLVGHCQKLIFGHA